MLQAKQVTEFYLDVSDLDYTTAVALMHSRYSTNTFPSWERAHPNRYTIHNGEINTILGNQKRMNARQSNIKTDLFGVDVQNVFPIVNEDGSDSAMFDNALEFLLMTGRTLPHSAMMMIPRTVGEETRRSRTSSARFMNSTAMLWTRGTAPAAICATNGIQSLAMLDRNGLRPAPLHGNQRRYAHPRQRDRRAEHPAGKRCFIRTGCAPAECCWWIPRKAA